MCVHKLSAAGCVNLVSTFAALSLFFGFVTSCTSILPRGTVLLFMLVKSVRS